MNKQIELALKKAVEMGWITINTNLKEEALALHIREYIAEASFRDIMEFFNRP